MARNKDFFVNSTPKRDKSFFVKEDTAKKTNNLWVESKVPNSLEKKSINTAVKPVNISDFVKSIDNSDAGKSALLEIESEKLQKQIKQKEQEYNRANNYRDWNQKMQAQSTIQQELNELNSKLDATKTSLAGLNSAKNKLLTAEQVAENNKNAPLSQKIDKAINWDIPKTAEKVGRTALDLGANIAVGATNAFEGMADTAVGNLGAAASGVTSGFGLAPNELSEKIKKGAEDFVKFNFSGEEILEEKKNEGTGIYEPKILGVKVRDAVNTISNMLTSATFGGTAGFMASAAGQNIEEALLDNQNLNRAVVYGDIAGVVEGLTEKMFDAVKLLGGGKFDKFLPKGAIGKLIGGAGGEAVEEVITEGIDPFLKYLTYKKGTYDMPTLVEYLKNLKDAAWNGFVIGLIMKGGQDVSTPEIRDQYKQEVYTAVDKSKLPENVKQTVKDVMITPAQAQINQDLQNLRNQNLQNVNSTIQRENVTGLPKLNVQNQVQSQETNQANTITSNQTETAQNANMEQVAQKPNLPTQKAQKTLQSAKIAGMTDMDMQKAIDLNNMLRSGASLEFYDAKNIPQGLNNEQQERAKEASGFYKDGTLWINKNSKNKVEQILGHELTHHLQTTDSYTDLSNTILDSEVFYDFIAEKGYANVAEYKAKLKEMGYTDAQMNNEMVARFVEGKMFTDQASIDRLARQNTKLVEKIKNWISDLVVSFKGTSQEKELRRIENMYRKALEQARNSTATAETQYSIAGVKAMENINYAELTNAYNEAKRTGQNTKGWFKDKEGNWKFEISDKDMTLKKNLQLSDTGNRLGDILEHDALFRAYPELADTIVNFKDIKDASGFFHKGTKEITLNKKLFNTKEWKKNVEASLIHEIQHAIQEIEGYPGAANPFWSKKAYYEALGEIEASDTKERFLKEKDGKLNRSEIKPRSSEPNPKHRKYDEYMSKRGIVDKIKDAAFPYYAGKGGKGYEILEETMVENNKSDLRADDSRGLRRYVNDTAGKEPAFSMPETDNQGRTLSKEQQEFFKDSKVRDENGKLIEVFHGTDSDFTVFESNAKTKNGKMFGEGIYLTSDKTQAEKYTKTGKVLTVYANINNPLKVERYSAGDLVYSIRNINPFIEADIYKNDGDISPKKIKQYLIDNGYDGINIADKTYVAFYPKQIKNIDNTNPTENPDIRYSMNQTKGGRKTTSTKALSTYAQTLQSKHQDIPEQVNLIQKEVDNGNFMHEVVHDKRALNYAQKYIEENGFEDAVNHWDELIKRGKPVDKDELALGQTIYNIAVDNKDTRLVMKMASDLVQEYTEIGRNLQSATLLRKMTPDGRLYALERSVQKINQDLMQKFDDFENIKIPEELADKLLRSETKTDMDKAVEQIQEYIASKIPATWQEKLNSWRYLAMLGNPRTHIRNIVGNAVFIPAVEVKNALAQVGELAISKDQRTKAIVTSLNKNDAKLLKYAENDFDNNRETIRGENKYDIKAGVQEKRTIYSWKAIEAARRGNFNLLETEDTLFLKYRYKKAFAGALKARGITIEQLRENSPETVKKVSEIRNYAINEAQKATYRDASKVAAILSRGKRKLLNAANQSTGAARLGYNLAYLGAEGVMPFAKTPINIVKRGLEYSPAGLLNGIKDAALNVKNGKKTAAQAIDEIAAGATGTAIAAFGLFLASQGLVSGGEEEKDKEQALKELKGNQNYSFNAFGKSYTIDWTAPSSIPLFIGVELYNSIASEDESAYLNALSNLVEPVVEMSMLQGINDTLKTMGEENAIGNIISKTLMNYLGQYNPTLLGQMARSADPLRRTTYVDKNIPIPAAAQRFIQQQAAKIPGVSRMLPTYKDQFGQEQLTDGVLNRIVQNFFSPGYLKDIKEGTVEQGLTELYEKTGETSVIPSYASKTLTHNGEKINLTAKQYDTYAKTRGDLSKKGLEGLFKDNYYKSLNDEQKVKVVEAIYDYAGKIAKTKVIDGYELEFNDKKIQKLQNEGLDFYKYILLKKTADADGNDYTSNDELEKAIKKYGLSRWQKTIKEKNTKSTKTTNTLPTLSQRIAKLPTLKK